MEKIATLEVYLNTDSPLNVPLQRMTDEEYRQTRQQSTHLEGKDDTNFRLIFSPEYDRKMLSEQAHVKLTDRTLPSILAHELGHFVARILKDPTHDSAERRFNGEYPAEVTAWNLATNIFPNIDAKLRDSVLAGYRIQDKQSAFERLLIP